MNAVAVQPHVTLSGDRAGEYLIEEERPDGRLVLVRDTSIAAIRRRQGSRALSPAEFTRFMAEHGPHMAPPDGEG